MVQGPQLLRVETWQRSGHYDHYRQNMYFTQIEDDAYGIKPMNCISHMLIFKNELRSYRDMPQRYFELGVVHRHEKSGVLHGLLRVRQFTQDDAHILCTPEQLEGEILEVIHLIRDLMNLFNFQFKVAISTRPEDSIGTDEAWELATNALIQAVQKADMPYEINEGDGAFYGPKIDVRLLDCIGREWQCSTIQVDFTLPERFDLTYVGSGRRAASPGHGAPRYHGLAGALHRRAHRAVRRGHAHLARAGAGPHPYGDRSRRRGRPQGAGGTQGAGHPRLGRSAERKTWLQGARGAGGQDSVHSCHW